MFSIIICSIQPLYLEQLKSNISGTIGQPYELLVWDNRETKKGLCEVYNLLAAKASFPYLCFIHEDILFSSSQWGSSLLDIFRQDEGLGLVGISGSKYKSRTLSGCSSGIPELECINITHRNARNETMTLFNNPFNTSLEPVILLDGVFLVARKPVWQETLFNESMLKGFHLYDLDFSFRVQKKHRVAVLFSINLVHLTEGGNFGNEWICDTIRWHQAYQNELPASLTPEKTGQLERQIRKNWLFRLRLEKIRLRNKIRWIMYSGSLKQLTAWPYIFVFLFPSVHRIVKKLLVR